MDHYKELMGVLEKQSPLYRPGVFWQVASSEIIKDLFKYGLESFRAHPSSLSFLFLLMAIPVMLYQVKR